jgi:hypothetical protein
MAIAKNDFYTAVFGRHNVIKKFIYQIFISIASWPRLLLEVFVRQEFGQRYFSFSTACILTTMLSAVPYVATRFTSYGNVDFFKMVIDNVAWYIFLGAFMYCCVKRRQEIKRRGKLYSMKYFSLSAGKPNPKIDYYSLFGKNATSYRIVTTLEPAIFLILGILLLIASQKLLGITLIVCSVIYAISWRAQFALSHEYFLDWFDSGICDNEVMNQITGKKNKTGFDAFTKESLDVDDANKIFENEDEIIDGDVEYEPVVD